MNQFLQTVLTFPTLVYSVILAVCVVYWLLAATGLVEIDGADGMLGLDGDSIETTGAAAMISRLGLSGVPLMLILTVLGFVGWVGTYYVHLLVLDPLPAGLRIPIGVVVAVLVLVPGLVVTSMLLRPVSRLMLKLRPPVQISMLGRTAIVCTPSVDAGYGQAELDEDGVDLTLQVRYHEPDRFQRGARVVLIEYLGDQHAYRVIPEEQFRSL